MLNPAPVNDAMLMLSGAVPEEVSVTICGAELLLTATLPKFKPVVLRCSAGTYAPSLMENVLVVDPAEALSVAVCAVVTGETAAVNAAVDDPAGTVSEPGTVTALSLLDRVTLFP